MRDLTPKMKIIFKDIRDSLLQLPLERKEYIFGPEDELDEDLLKLMAGYITLEYIKYAYDSTAPLYSLRHFLEEIGADDSERMMHQRIMQYVLKYKKEEIAQWGIELPKDHKYYDLNMETIEKKLSGYKMSEMNFYEHNNIHDLEIIKAIVEKRIMSTKKVPNDRFRDMFEKYDDEVERLRKRSEKNDEDMVFATLAFFTLEWHYPIELLYAISCRMEKEDNKDIDRDVLMLLCGNFVTIESMFDGSVTMSSRMVLERTMLFSSLFSKKLTAYARQEMMDWIKEILVLGEYYKECVTTEDGEAYKERFRKETGMPDWASFLERYNLFLIWERKEWTNTRIRNMRKLFDMVSAKHK